MTNVNAINELKNYEAIINDGKVIVSYNRDSNVQLLKEGCLDGKSIFKDSYFKVYNYTKLLPYRYVHIVDVIYNIERKKVRPTIELCDKDYNVITTLTNVATKQLRKYLNIQEVLELKNIRRAK